MRMLYNNRSIGSAGSCSAVGYVHSSCCLSVPCKGEPPNCYCDSLCYIFKDCCPDANTPYHTNNITSGNIYLCTCNTGTPNPRMLQADSQMTQFKYLLINILFSNYDSLHMHMDAGRTTVLNFISRPRSLTTNQSSRVVFECSVCSISIPTFKWNFTRKGSTEAQRIERIDSLSADYSITRTGQRSQVLIITNVQWRNEGVYSCTVSSENSQVQAQASLNIPSESLNAVHNIEFEYHYNHLQFL